MTSMSNSKHFKKVELECSCCSIAEMDEMFMLKLEQLRHLDI